MIFAGVDGRHGDHLLEREAERQELAHHPGEIRHARRVAGEHVDVGRDRVGRAALRDRRLRHRVVEAAAAVADVEDHAALLGGERRRQQLAVLHDVGEGAGDVGRARIGVGEDVARRAAGRGSATSARRVSTPPMWHMTLAPVPAASHAAIARLSGSRPCLAITFSDMRTLTPSTMSAFSATALRGRVGLREVDVVELGHRERRQPDIGDVHERVEPRARLRHHVAAEGREIVGAGIARRHAGGGALVRDQLVGRNADRRAVGKDVGVQVDQARRHQLARRRRARAARAPPGCRPRPPRSRR